MSKNKFLLLSPLCGLLMCVCVYVCELFSSVPMNFCDPMNCSLPGSSAHGILQARILEWIPIPFSRGSP